jgi:hypothetical protein
MSPRQAKPCTMPVFWLAAPSDTTKNVLVDLLWLDDGQVPAWVRAYRSSRALTAGTPEELAERLRAFAHAGISHVQLWLEPNTMANIDAFLPVPERLDRG